MATLADGDQQRQNAKTVERLIRSRGLTLRRQARRHSASADQVDDVLQRSYELFIERYAPPYEPLPWLMTTVKREAWAQSHRPHRRCEIPISTKDDTGEYGYELAECLSDPGCGPAEIAAERDDAREICRRLGELKADERSALCLLSLGYSYAEIAAIRGWTYTKVNRCISEGRSSLRAKVTER